jgi:hypothetical protein
MAEEQTAKLTLNDPVDAETMKKLSEIHEARMKVADRIVDLELEKIRLMVAVRQIDSEKNRIFEQVLTERGLPQGFPISVEGVSGKIQPLADIPDQKGPAPVAE